MTKKSYDVAQFLWVEGKLSTVEKLCLASFLDHGYEVHLYSYRDVSGIPKGVKVKSGTDILPSSKLFLAPGVNNKPSYAAFSDLFRYHLLTEKGGWWFDMDTICLQHLPPPSNLTFASTWEGKWGQRAMGCALWSLPNDPYINVITERSEAKLFSKKSKSVGFGAIGPSLIHSFVEENKLEDSIAPWWEFCPYPWRLIHLVAPSDFKAWSMDQPRQIRHLFWEFFKPDFRAGRIRSTTRTLHLHNEIWSLRGMDKNDAYFRWSLFESLKRKHFKTWSST